jgi:hypothetical protein
MFALVPALNFDDPFFQLSNDAPDGIATRGTEAAVVTKSAPAQGDRAVDVGARETGVKRNALNAKTVNLLEIIAVTEITVSISPPVQIVPVKLMMLNGDLLRSQRAFRF